MGQYTRKYIKGTPITSMADLDSHLESDGFIWWAGRPYNIGWIQALQYGYLKRLISWRAIFSVVKNPDYPWDSRIKHAYAAINGYVAQYEDGHLETAHTLEECSPTLQKRIQRKGLSTQIPDIIKTVEETEKAYKEGDSLWFM